MSLEDKITSKDHPALAQHLDHSIGHLDGLGEVAVVPWYLRREYLRLQKGVYPVETAVLSRINNHNAAYAVHISKEDQKLIAYTPDRAYGEADRQVKTTLGRFLTKYYPHLPDEAIAALTVDHLSELDTTFEILRGQELVNVYRSGALGSCMSKSDVPKPGGYHPAEAYDMPGIAMAVLRDEEGKINARCLILEEKKIFIRVYGDRKLRSKLERTGYKPGGWEGVEFKRIDYGDNVVMPYLDCFGGPGASHGSCVAILGDKLLGVSKATHDRLKTMFGEHYARPCTSTTGLIYLEPVPMDKVQVTCGLTGREVNQLTETMHDYWDGTQLLRVCVDALEAAGMTVTLVTDSGPKRVLCSTSTVTFNHGAYLVVDTPKAREHYGYVKLDAALYPDEQGWVQPYYLTARADGSYIKEEDSVTLVDALCQITKVHKSEVQKGWVKIHSMTKGRACYATSDTVVLKTVTGRKVVAGYHSIATTWEGVTDFTRNLTRQYFNYLGEIWRVKGTPPLSPDSDYIIGTALEELAKAKNKVDMARRLINRLLGMSIQSYVTTTQGLREHSGGYYYTQHKLYQALVYAVEVWEVEAKALDYNLPVEVVAHPEVEPGDTPAVADSLHSGATSQGLPEPTTTGSDLVAAFRYGMSQAAVTAPAVASNFYPESSLSAYLD